MNGNPGLAVPAPPPETQKAKKWYKLIPRELALARHTGTPATQGPSFKSTNHDIQETPNNKAENEKNNWRQKNHNLIVTHSCYKILDSDVGRPKNRSRK